MNKTKIIKYIRSEIESLKQMPYFNPTTSHDVIAIKVLAQQDTISILEKILNKIEEKEETVHNDGEFVM